MKPSFLLSSALAMWGCVNLMSGLALAAEVSSAEAPVDAGAAPSTNDTRPSEQPAQPEQPAPPSAAQPRVEAGPAQPWQAPAPAADVPAMSLATPAESNELEELSLSQLLDVSVVASKRAETIADAPSSITVFTAEKIAALGLRYLNDVFQFVPGFDVRRSKEQTQLVTVRGITSESNEHLLIMMDGVRLGNMYEGGAGKDTRQISLEDVQRIEIIRGPGSALYGTGAFAAVVSVITKKGSDTAGVHVTGEAGSYGGRATKVRAGQKFGDLNINGNFGYAESTGENFFIGQDGAGQSGNIRDPYMEIFGNLKLSYSEFELSSAISHQTYPAFITTGDVFDPISFGKSSWFITSLDHRHEFSKSLSWQSKLAFAYDERGPTLAMIWPPGLNAKFPAGQYGHPHLDDHRYSLDTYVSYVPIKDMTLIAGGAAELNTTSNYDHPSNGPNRTGVPESKFFDDSTRRIVVAGYAQGDYRFFKGLKLTAGVRYDHYNDFGGTTNPRVALVYNYRDKAWIKALYATAFRAPSYRELYATSPTNKGDPANKPETITTGELVFGAAPWRQLTATVSLFDSEVKNLIYRNQAAAADGSYPLQNHGNLTAMGVEAEIKSEILPGLELAGNYTYVHSRTSVFGNTYDTPVVSHHVANFTISRDLYHHLRLSVLGEYRSAKTRYVVAGDPASDPRSPCGEVFLVGAYARVYDLVEGVAGYVRVTNALDSQYSTPSAYPAKVKGVTPDDIHNRGIEIQAGLTYSFK